RIGPATYTLRIRHDGGPEGVQPVPRLSEVKPGAGFPAAGAMEVPGMAAADLKLDEVVFYKVKGTKGQTLHISAAFQKPWYDARYIAIHQIEAKYTLTVYDDDQ